MSHSWMRRASSLPWIALTLLGVQHSGPAPARAADGDLDPTFQDAGKWVKEVASLGGRAAAVAPDGRLLVGYTATIAGSDRDLRVMPVPDQGITTHCGSYHPDLGGTNDDRLLDIAVHGDDVIVAGSAAGPADQNWTRLVAAKFDTTNCQMVTEFGGNDGLIFDMGTPIAATSIDVDWFGHVDVAAKYGPSNFGVRYFGVGTDGEIDDQDFIDFNPAFGATAFETGGIFVQPDGRMIIVGTMVLPGGDRDVGVAVLASDGSLDEDFSIDGLAGFSYDIIDSGFDEGNAVAALPDGRIVVVGSVQRPGGHDAAVAILTPTGGFFNDFGIVGRYSWSFLPGNRTDLLRAIAIQGDGRIVVGGPTIPEAPFTDVDFAVARLLPTGDNPLDSTFATVGHRTVAFDEGGSIADSLWDLTLGQGGRITLVGSVATGDGTALGAARLRNSYIFADGFEWGVLFGGGWSLVFDGGGDS